MRWSRKTDVQREAERAAERDRIENWHRSFAYIPHRTPTGWIWLEWGSRKLTWQPGIGWEGDGAGYSEEWRYL